MDETTETTIEQTEILTEMPAKKKTATPKRKRITFYIRPPGAKRRKKVSFLVRR
jgi:hypothetical protein